MQPTQSPTLGPAPALPLVQHSSNECRQRGKSLGTPEEVCAASNCNMVHAGNFLKLGRDAACAQASVEGARIVNKDFARTNIDERRREGIDRAEPRRCQRIICLPTLQIKVGCSLRGLAGE